MSKRKKQKKRKSIETIKKELFERIRSQVADRLGAQDKEIQKSDRSFSRFFSQNWKKSSAGALQKQLQSSQIVFWGDFHGVRQYQKNLLRTLKQQDLTVRPIIVALECLPSKSQKHVDAYLQGNITENEFLSRVKWDRVWGFPWAHYKPIFDWAKDKKQKLIVINGPEQKSTSKQREKWGVQILLKTMKAHPIAQIFVLYGEYHLLPKCFPSLVKTQKMIKPIFIFQNSDKLYFSSQGEVFKLGTKYYCVQSVSPWVKWQNYNLFLESSGEIELEEEFDLTEPILNLSKILAQTLQMELDPNNYAVFTSGDRALWDHLKKLPESKLSIFEGLIEEGLSFVDGPEGWAFQGRISANESANLAMQALIFQFNPQLNWNLDSESKWNFLIWINTLSYFGSKLINPHRKTASLIDLQKKSRGVSTRPVERQAARLAVNYTLHQSLGGESSLASISLSDSVRFQAVKWISSLLGEKLFNAYNHQAVGVTTIKSFLKKNPQDKNFHVVIQSLYEAVEGY